MSKLSQWGGKLLLVVVSTLLALLLAEIASRYLYPVEIAHFEDCQGRPTEIRLNDPELEVRLKPNFCGQLVGSEFKNSIRTNSSGFRDSQEFVKSKGDAYRIFGLGDSFTFGWGVEPEQTFLSLLGRKLSAELGGRVEIFNLGVWSYGTIQEVKVFHMFQDYHPDLVILQFYARDAYIQEAGNDLVDNYEFDHWYKSRKDPKGRRGLTATAAKRLIAQHCNLCKIFVLEFGAYVKGNFHPRGDEQRKEVAWQITKNELLKFDRDLESMKIKCVLLWIPPPGTIRAKDNAVFERLSSFPLYNIVLVNPLNALSGNTAAYYYSLDTHWRPAGHQVVADLLSQTITAHALLPRRQQAQAARSVTSSGQ